MHNIMDMGKYDEDNNEDFDENDDDDDDNGGGDVLSGSCRFLSRPAQWNLKYIFDTFSLYACFLTSAKIR